MFGLFKRKPDLRRAIAALSDHASPANETAFRNALVDAILYVVAAHVPDSWNGLLVLEDEITLQMLTSTAPEGGIALLCFSDIDEVRARTGSDRCLGLRLADINALVVNNGYAAIVVNPSGPWAALSAADLGALVARKR